ncbi:MAG: quinolinate synthase NadA, partial [Dehalococcoidia bacterium]|nr:quinolinate synthase NadA [Dehalococcoidia bacterium]
CSVHTRFTVSQIDAARVLHPDINIIVHPECPMETVQAADMVGSTEFIREQVNSAPPGSKWGIGTEVSLVNRLAINNSGKTVFCLDSVTCPCSTMYRIHPAYLLWMLDGLLEGKVNNEITVPDDIKRDSKIALERMLSLR